MANLDGLLKALDMAVWEMGEAFKGLPDDDVWCRAHPRLLSVGELAAHVAYWEAASFFSENAVDSPLVTAAARYYTTNVGEPFALPIGAEATYAEVKRIHALCKDALAANPHDSDDPNALRGDWTWGFTIEYQVFHVSYHTGQMYSVRHLLGHETVDN